MSALKKAGAVTPTKIQYNQRRSYQRGHRQSNLKKELKIQERRAQIPDIHKANYGKAMRGKSMKAGMKAFCLECVGWQKEEVRYCTDLACPLYPYRPYKTSSKQGSEGLSFG